MTKIEKTQNQHSQLKRSRIWLLAIIFVAIGELSVARTASAVCNLTIDDAGICNSCTAGEHCLIDGSDIGVCTLLSAGTETISLPSGRSVGAGDKICSSGASTDQISLPCVVRFIGGDCTHCNIGDTCYQNGTPAGQCQESTDGNARTCSTTDGPSTTPRSPIVPLLSVNIPTVTFGSITGQEDGDITSYSLPWIADYVFGVYRYANFFGGILAAVMLMIGGIEWLTAGGNSGKAEKARTRITDSVIGLALMILAYLILLTINPQLVSLSTLQLKTVKQDTYSQAERFDRADAASSALLLSDIAPETPAVGSGDSASGDSASGDNRAGCYSGTILCQTVDRCRALCERGQSNWPRCNSVTVDPSGLTRIPSSPGLIVRGNQLGSTALISQLARAGQIAQTHNPNYTIEVVSAFRSLQSQISIACQKIENGTESSLGTSAAWPGGSAHGMGLAVDVRLLENNRPITTTSYGGQTGRQYREATQMLLQIMSQAGFIRFKKEIWHFELPNDTACRCSAGSCPWPPTTCGDCSGGNFECQ
ncbi:MAG: D-alanyl-D-alanine carboxypeptidase family protein [Patescibacteria group bacterium]